MLIFYWVYEKGMYKLKCVCFKFKVFRRGLTTFVKNDVRCFVNNGRSSIDRVTSLLFLFFISFFFVVPVEIRTIKLKAVFCIPYIAVRRSEKEAKLFYMTVQIPQCSANENDAFAFETILFSMQCEINEYNNNRNLVIQIRELSRDKEPSEHHIRLTFLFFGAK